MCGKTIKKKKGNNKHEIQNRVGQRHWIGPRAYDNCKCNGNEVFLKLNHVYKYQCPIIFIPYNNLYVISQYLIKAIKWNNLMSKFPQQLLWKITINSYSSNSSKGSSFTHYYLLSTYYVLSLLSSRWAKQTKALLCWSLHAVEQNQTTYCYFLYLEKLSFSLAICSNLRWVFHNYILC